MMFSAAASPIAEAAGDTVSFEAEKVLVAVGRRANTDALNQAAYAHANSIPITPPPMMTMLSGIFSRLNAPVESIQQGFSSHKNAISARLTSGVAGLLRMNKITKVDGTAAFTGPKILEVTKADGTKEKLRAVQQAFCRDTANVQTCSGEHDG